ncbi:MAG: L,D-transpeptidase family protein, partial [Deltaproteobacteria bacterium]|nr:L,D-transpeptidase family protein [Deltaproteobacteria bacterium]
MIIRIYKQKKILQLWRATQLLKEYPVAVGKNQGQKEKEGDLRTPEGEYVVCVKNPHSKYHLSLGLNYPNNEDAKRGLENGVISTQEYQAICDANNQGGIPPWKTALGGEIYI